METLPTDVCLKILSLLDHQNLSSARQVCRKWKILASENVLWHKLFKERLGTDRAIFNAPSDSKSWKDAYEVQDRCDRVGLGMKIIREGDDYYIIHQGQIKRHLSSKTQENGGENEDSPISDIRDPSNVKEPREGMLDRILFFIGDLESATCQAKRSRLM